MYLTIICLILIVAVVASGLNEGLWGNFLTLVNALLAVLLAINFWEPAAAWLSEQVRAGRYAWDFAALWLLFALFMFAFRTVTDFLSRMKVRFIPPVDKGVGVLFSLLTGWILACFLVMSLHTAPLARNSFRGSFVPEETLFFGADRMLLGFAQRASLTTLSALNSSDAEESAFDPRGEFIIKYASRRGDYESRAGFSGDK